MIKPIIKWVGGKTQIIHDILNKFPKKIDTYHEIFVGGGSVILGLLDYCQKDLIKVNNFNVYDKNIFLENPSRSHGP